MDDVPRLNAFGGQAAADLRQPSARLRDAAVCKRQREAAPVDLCRQRGGKFAEQCARQQHGGSVKHSVAADTVARKRVRPMRQMRGKPCLPVKHLEKQHARCAAQPQTGSADYAVPRQFACGQRQQVRRRRAALIFRLPESCAVRLQDADAGLCVCQ